MAFGCDLIPFNLGGEPVTFLCADPPIPPALEPPEKDLVRLWITRSCTRGKGHGPGKFPHRLARFATRFSLSDQFSW